MNDYTATYSPDDNKLRLYAAGRLPRELYDRVRAAGFIWAAKQELFVAPMWTPERADLLIELAGEIDDEDKSLVERADERAERFDDYRENRAAEAESARKAVDRIASGIPLGQPILVGHHSERHARRDAAKIENGMRRAVKLWETSKYWQDRAAGALRHAKYKELPAVRARRIKTIEADKRRFERQRDDAAKWIKAWGGLNAPHADRTPADEALRLKRALFIANYSHEHLQPTPERPNRWSLWSELQDGHMGPREAQLIALKANARQIAHARRWIAHCELRLTYERAMLVEQGAAELLSRKPKKSAKSELPLCNYRAPGGLEIANIYNRGEMIHYPQIDMTKAEYAKINADYKGTRVVDHSHRVRTTMQRHTLVCVFLTDSLVHERPKAAEPPEPPTRPTARPNKVDSGDAAALTSLPEPAPFEAMRASLQAGVQVVSAPQLFPTPEHVARRVIELADIQPAHRVLEPSAGTGRLLAPVEAIVRPNNWGQLVAVELNQTLAHRIRGLYPRWELFAYDFLCSNGEIGTFDRIVMNPPFENGADIKHIQHARRLLNPGGRLVAICANGPRQQAALQSDALVWEELEAGTFDGTGVRAVICVLDKAE